MESDQEGGSATRYSGRRTRAHGTGALALAENPLGNPPPGTLSKSHAALIEAIYRSVYMMATLKRDELLDAGRDQELDDLVAASRRTMDETMQECPQGRRKWFRQ